MKTRLEIIDTGSGPQPWCLVQVTDEGRHPVRANMLVRDECGDVKMLHGRVCGETRDECVTEVLACLAAYIDLAAKPRVDDTLRLTDAERYAVIAGLRSLERALYADPENMGGKYRDMQQDAATLRGLLERHAKGGGA